MTTPSAGNFVNGLLEDLLAFDAKISADTEMIKRLGLLANRHIKSGDITTCRTTISCHIHSFETSRAAKTFVAAIWNIFVPEPQNTATLPIENAPSGWKASEVRQAKARPMQRGKHLVFANQYGLLIFVSLKSALLEHEELHLMKSIAVQAAPHHPKRVQHRICRALHQH